jgi:hypothetical protein
MEKIDDKTLVSAGVCPNCWGRQSYDEKYVNYVRDLTKSEVNKDSLHRKSFILKFVENHISGIKLKNGSCPSCGGSY